MTLDDFCHSLGVIPPNMLVPGRWIRCHTESHPRKKNGAVRVSDDGLVAWIMDWATMEKPEMWKHDSIGERKVDYRAISQRKIKRIEDTSEAIRSANQFWNCCLPLDGPTPYMEAKGLSVEGCGMIRRTKDGETVVPMYSYGKLTTVQRIKPDGEKKFWYGAPSKGCTLPLWRKGASVAVLCEGFATGVTLWCAIPTASVTITFSASNLILAASSMNLRGMCVIAADNDHETQAKIGTNPGVDAANKASLACRAGVAIPDVRGSDWNDFFCEKLMALKDDNMLSKFKKRPEILRRDALACVQREVMRHAKFISP